MTDQEIRAKALERFWSDMNRKFNTRAGEVQPRVPLLGVLAKAEEVERTGTWPDGEDTDAPS